MLHSLSLYLVYTFKQWSLSFKQWSVQQQEESTHAFAVVSISASVGVIGCGVTRRDLFVLYVAFLCTGPREREEGRELVDFRRFNFLFLESSVVFVANSHVQEFLLLQQFADFRQSLVFELFR